jgi:hypothetical protein
MGDIDRAVAAKLSERRHLVQTAEWFWSGVVAVSYSWARAAAVRPFGEASKNR